MAVVPTKNVEYYGTITQNQDGTLQGTRTIILWTDFPTKAYETDETTIYNSPICPKWGSSHPEDERLVCVSVNVEPEDGADGRKWTIQAEYATSFVDGVISDNTSKPWELPAYDISVTPVPYEVALTKAYNVVIDERGLLSVTDKQYNPSTFVKNSAGDLYVNPPTVTVYNTVVRFSYNRRIFELPWIPQYCGTVNAEAISVLGFRISAYKGRINNIQASRVDVTDVRGVRDLNNSYWRIDVEVEIVSGKEHWVEMDNYGFNFMQEVGGTLTKRPIHRTLPPAGELTEYGYLPDEVVAGTAEKVPDQMPLDFLGRIATDSGGDIGDPDADTFYPLYPISWLTLQFPEVYRPSTNLEGYSQ